MKPAQNLGIQALYGFTLVELLITIGIILVLTAALIPSFNSVIQTQHVKVAQQQVKDDIRNLVNKGFTYNNFDTGGSGTGYFYYGLVIETDMARSYKFFTSTVTSGCPPSDMQVVGKSNELPSDVGLKVISLPYCVEVNVLKPDTITSTINTSTNICTGMPFCINITPVNAAYVTGCYAVGFNLYGGIKTFQGACP